MPRSCLLDEMMGPPEFEKYRSLLATGVKQTTADVDMAHQTSALAQGVSILTEVRTGMRKRRVPGPGHRGT